MPQSKSLLHHRMQHASPRPSFTHSKMGPHVEESPQRTYCVPVPAGVHVGMLFGCGKQCWAGPHPGPGFSGSQFTTPLPVELIELLEATVVDAADVDATVDPATVVEATVDPATVELAELFATVEFALLFATVLPAVEFAEVLVEPLVDCIPPAPALSKPSPSSVAPVAQANRVAEAREKKTTVERTPEE